MSSVLEQLDELRCASRWTEVAELAAQSPSDPAAVIAQVESRVAHLEVTGQSYGLTPMRNAHEELKGLLKQIPDVSLDHDTAFIRATLRGQLHLLTGHVKTALSCLDETFEVPKDPRPYIGAMTVKSRAVMTAAYLHLKKIDQAVEASQSVLVSDRTLEGNHEAAVWAARLAYLQAGLNLENSHEKYQKAVSLGGLSGDSRIPELSEPHATTNGLEVPSNGVNGTRRSLDVASAHSGKTGSPTSPSNALRRSLSRHKTHSKRHSLQPGEATALQLQMAKQQSIEAEAESAVRSWRETVTLQHPTYRLIIEEDIKRTIALRNEIFHWIEITFDSPVLMRLLTEILISLGDYEEAYAAFEIYFQYQKLQILKKKSGAHANPDDELASAKLFALVLTIIVSGPPLPNNTQRVDAVSTLENKLEEAMPQSSNEAIGIAKGVLGRAYAWQSWNVVGDDYFQNRSRNALSNIEESLKTWEGDAPTLYARALMYCQAGETASGFMFTKAALSTFQDYIPLWHLLIVLLTSNGEFEMARLTVGEFLENLKSQDLSSMSRVFKLYLLEIKLVQVAIYEALNGISGAMKELDGTIDFIYTLYPDADLEGLRKHQERVNQKPAHGRSARAPGEKRKRLHRILRRKARPEENTTAIKKQSMLRLAKDTSVSPTQLAIVWLWVAQLFLRADLPEDAAEAVQAAEDVAGPTANVLAVQGQIVLDADPQMAWKLFTDALAIDTHNISAVIGRSQIIEASGRVKHGVVDASIDSEIFATPEDELEAIRNNLCYLQDITTRHPGRYVAEAWYYRGVILQSLGDDEQAKEALWKSVALEESVGVRPFFPNHLASADEFL